MSELDMLKVGDTDESLVVLMEKAGEVVSGSCWLLDIDTGDGVSNWVVSWAFIMGGLGIALSGCGVPSTVTWGVSLTGRSGWGVPGTMSGEIDKGSELASRT